MAAVIPGMMLAADMNTAMLYNSGPVMVNGSGKSKATAIFAGDRLQVPVQSAATIAARGSSITVAAGSAVTFRGVAIALEPRSAVSISTTDGMAVQVVHLTIAPADKSGQTKFQVARTDGNVVIAANAGAVVVWDDSEKKVTVPEGKSTAVPDGGTQGPPQTTPGGVRVSEPSVLVPTLVGLGAAGAAVGISIATTGLPVSPTH